MKIYRLALIAAIVSIGGCSTADTSSPYLLIGTYTSGSSKGIHVYKFNTTTADFTPVSETPTENPSYLVPSPDQNFVYAVNEGVGEKGTATAFAFNADSGTLRRLDTELTGDNPCYINIDKAGKTVMVANYSGGSLTVIP